MGKFANEQQLIVENNLPLRRWKIGRIRTGRDKRLRRLDKEHTRVWKQIQNLGYEDLIPPVQRGYKRLFVLTDETKYHKQAGFYQLLLDKINTVWYSPDKIFKTKKRKIKKWRYQNRKEQRLRELDSRDFHHIRKLTEEEKQFFNPVEYYDDRFREHRIKYVFTEPWRFVLRIQPNMITKVQIKDLELEQYRDELDSFLDMTENRRRLIKLKLRYSSWWKGLDNEKRYAHSSLANIPLHETNNQYKKEKELLWE
jgi:hypothetical protein